MASRVLSPVPAGVSIPKPKFLEKIKRNGLRRNGRLKRWKPLKTESRTRRLASRIYSVKRKQFMHYHPICEFGECFARSEECHHVHLRNGKNYLDSSTWLALCRDHHRWIHDHARKARSLGLFVSP